MRYVFDNDLHIHSKISLCSGDPEQTSMRILEYAKENSLKTICLTDHFWDENVQPPMSQWYAKQDYNHISAALPLPKAEGIRFLFGCETEMDMNMRLGLSKERFSDFEADTILRPYKIARDAGCKFYMGSDAHHPKELDNAKEIFERAIDLLGLTENEKFSI